MGMFKMQREKAVDEPFTPFIICSENYVFASLQRIACFIRCETCT